MYMKKKGEVWQLEQTNNNNEILIIVMIITYLPYMTMNLGMKLSLKVNTVSRYRLRFKHKKELKWYLKQNIRIKLSVK